MASATGPEERPVHGGKAASWLSNVMDGLGIASACVVAETTFFADAERFAAAAEGRVRRVALLEARAEGAGVLRLRE